MVTLTRLSPVALPVIYSFIHQQFSTDSVYVHLKGSRIFFFVWG